MENNTIYSKQNEVHPQALLLAQRVIYSKAKTWSIGVLIFAIALFVAQFFKIHLGDWLGYVSLFSGFIIWLLDKKTTTNIETAAKIQEAFDTEVFDLPWNDAKIGTRVPKETILEATANKKVPADFQNWYSPAALSNLAPNLAILLCQRYNASYEFRLKKRFANLLLAFLVGFVVVLIALGIYYDLRLKTWVLEWLMPALGIIYKVYDLHDSFREVGKKQGDVFEECESEINTYKKTRILPSFERLRLIQDKIYKYRNQKSLVPDLVYNLSRTGYDATITKATEDIITELQNLR
jgi:hypothetical protein